MFKSNSYVQNMFSHRIESVNIHNLFLLCICITLAIGSKIIYVRFPSLGFSKLKCHFVYKIRMYARIELMRFLWIKTITHFRKTMTIIVCEFKREKNVFVLVSCHLIYCNFILGHIVHLSTFMMKHWKWQRSHRLGERTCCCHCWFCCVVSFAWVKPVHTV